MFMRVMPTHLPLPRQARGWLAALTCALMLSGCWIEPKTYVEPPPRTNSAPRPAVVPGPKPGSVYTVRQGDTLYAIAFRHGLDYRELARWNQLADPGRILVGQVLRLSAPSPNAPIVSAPPTSAPPNLQARPATAATTAPAMSSPKPLPTKPVSPPVSTPRPNTVSEAIGLNAGATTPPPKPAPMTGDGPAPTPIAEAPELAAPVPLASAPTGEARPVSTMPATKPEPGATPATTPTPAPPTPVTPPSPVPSPGQHVASPSAPPEAASPDAVAPSTAKPAPPLPATASVTTINPNAPTKQVSGIRWRWPAEGRLIGRFVAGDPTESGIEIGGKLGQVVTASADGEVVYSGNGLLGYGELIIIQHSPDFLSAYGHNQKRLVSEGTKVKAGQAIAEMGRQAGVDLLHFEIRQSGKPVDPLKFLP